MSTISEALKRAAGRAAAPRAGSSPSPAGDRLAGDRLAGDRLAEDRLEDRFPEALPPPASTAAPLAEPAPSAAPLAEPAPAAAADSPAAPRVGRGRQRLLWGLVACAALVLLAVVYARFRPAVETPAAQAEPTVWREKIIDERPKLLAELDLPEEYLGDETEPVCPPTAPEAKEPPQAVVPGPRRQSAPALHQPPKPQVRRPALRAAAYDEDEDEGDEENARPATAPLPRRPAPAAPRQVPNPTPPPLGNIAPGFRPPPATGSLPASQFAYNAPQRVTATPVAPMMAASPQPAPDATADLLRQATESERAGRLEQAAALYRLVLEKQPNREGVSVRLGNLLHRQSRFDEAAEVFRQALGQKRSAVLHNNLGSVYLAQKRLEEARQEFSAAADLEPKYADPHYNLACYHALAGRPEAGLAELEKAKEIDPQVMESAAGDADLAPLRALPEYKRLTE